MGISTQDGLMGYLSLILYLMEGTSLIYGIFKFSKPKIKTFKRHIWSYDKGNYDILRDKASSIDWGSLQDDDIDIYSIQYK